jgi:hypothetical protein
VPAGLSDARRRFEFYVDERLELVEKGKAEIKWETHTVYNLIGTHSFRWKFIGGDASTFLPSRSSMSSWKFRRSDAGHSVEIDSIEARDVRYHATAPVPCPPGYLP